MGWKSVASWKRYACDNTWDSCSAAETLKSAFELGDMSQGALGDVNDLQISGLDRAFP